ncbi:ABC transporter permease [Streptomyces sp. NY05-11A]|uniref:ABC transporter permease n=1 Tax=Streptomyces soliscabiei TaxID=588897 RepID=UPI0029A63623|nr:hypothetical protein [Streptomyces sp. NY05-11A]MDX2679236.1 hypothetical protein [Streptomyces sp. NY05-11A]
MKRLISSELRKLRATPTMWWLLAGTTLLAVAATIGAFVLSNAKDISLTSEEAIRGDLHAVGSGSILVAIAGIIGMAGEFRFGQSDQTFISEPRRARVLGVKLAVFAVLGALFGVIASLGTLATMWIWITSDGKTVPFGESYIWTTVGGAVASASIFGVLGVAIGAVARNQVVAIVGALGWLIVFEPIVFEASTEVGQWLPGAAAQALRQIPQDGLLSTGAGAAIFGVWTIAVLLVGYWRTTRNDLT